MAMQRFFWKYMVVTAPYEKMWVTFAYGGTAI
jgi:hypothetical protein